MSPLLIIWNKVTAISRVLLCLPAPSAAQHPLLQRDGAERGASSTCPQQLLEETSSLHSLQHPPSSLSVFLQERGDTGSLVRPGKPRHPALGQPDPGRDDALMFAPVAKPEFHSVAYQYTVTGSSTGHPAPEGTCKTSSYIKSPPLPMPGAGPPRWGPSIKSSSPTPKPGWLPRNQQEETICCS